MASSASPYRPVLAVPPSRFGRTFIVGGSIVLAGLSGFYMNMLRKKHIQQSKGQNPHFEQIVGHVSKQPAPGDPLPKLNATYSDMPPPIPRTEHRSGHATFDNFKQSSGYAEGGPATRYMVPPPQRGKNDGSGRAYTKSPNYTENYEKTTRPPPLVKEPTIDI